MAYEFRRWFDAPICESGFDHEQFEKLVEVGCPKCESHWIRVHGQARSNGVMTYRAICHLCETDVKELRHEISVEGLEEFVIPIGVNKGRKLSEAPVSWLKWASLNIEGSLGRKVRAYLLMREAKSRGF